MFLCCGVLWLLLGDDFVEIDVGDVVVGDFMWYFNL